MDRFLGRYSELIYAVTRIVVGMMYWMHGTTKILAWPSGAYLGPPIELLSLVGVAALIETIGGFMIMVGFRSSWAGFVCSGEMAAAYFLRQFPFAIFPIYRPPNIVGESAVFNCFFFLLVAAKGSGILSIDRFIEKRSPSASGAVPAPPSEAA